MDMREARSQDYYVLARLCLESAVRTRDDLLELLNDPAPQRPSTKSAPVAAMASAWVIIARVDLVGKDTSAPGGEAEDIYSG